MNAQGEQVRSGKRLMLFIVILSAFLRFYRIGHQSLWVDEILTMSVSDPKPGLTIWDYLKFNIHGPLHSLVVYLFHLISRSDGWLRLPSALAGIGAVIYIYRWVSIWLGERAALLSAALLALSPIHVYYSQELRNYSFLLFFALVASYHFHRFINEESKKDLVFFSLATVLAALSNFTAAFLFAAHTIIYFLRKGFRSRAILRWILVGLMIFVLISPWVYRIYTFIDVSRLVTPVLPGQLSTTERLRGPTTISMIVVPYTFFALSVGFSFGPSLRFLHLHPWLRDVMHNFGFSVLLVALVFGSLVLSGFISLVHRRLLWKEILIYLLIPLVITLVLCWQNAKAFNVRYVLLSLPAFLVLVACGLIGLKKRYAQVIFASILAGLMLISLGNYYFNGQYARENVRAATRSIEKLIGEDECILAPKVHEVISYYLSKPRMVYTVPSLPGISREYIESRLRKISSDCKSLWYVYARPMVDGQDEFILDVLSLHCRVDRTKEFEGLKIFHFVGRDSFAE